MTLNNKLIRLLLILFLVLYFLFLVISRAPAELAASAVHKAVPNFWLTGIEGTVWKGVAKGSQIDLPGSSLPLGRLEWKLSGLSLLMLNPCVTFSNREGAVAMSGEACYSITGSVGLEDVSLEGSIAPLEPLLNVPVSGVGSAQIAEATLGSGQIDSLEARVSWQNGAINLGSGWVNLGTFGADVTGNGRGGLNAKVVDVDSSIKADVQASVDLVNWKPTVWQVKGPVSLDENAPQMFKDGIQLVGEETEPGTYNIVLTSD